MSAEVHRQIFAENIATLAGLRTRALVDALASVPRERFLAEGPWVVRGEADRGGPPRTTPDGDPRHVYDNVSVAIDPERQLFNGAPGTVCKWIDALELKPGARVLHVGCGLGYYTALLAQTVGPSGRVIAIDVDPALATQARDRLASMSWVDVRQGDATAPITEQFDAIMINAGVTHARDAWLDALEPGGRLVVPLTATIAAMGPIGKGLLMLLTRRADGWFDARVLTFVAIYSAVGLRDDTLNQELGMAMIKRPFEGVGVLRRDRHELTGACWLHTNAFCLST